MLPFPPDSLLFGGKLLNSLRVIILDDIASAPVTTTLAP